MQLGSDGYALTIADPVRVLAGRYAKTALQNLGVWPPCENVRAALLFVARSEALLAIVYATDPTIDPGIRVIGTLPANVPR